MIEPSKIAVFLFVATAHLAVLAFGFPDLSSTSKADGGQPASASSPVDTAVGDKSPQNPGSVSDADKPRYGADSEREHDHIDQPLPAASPASANSSATRAGQQSDSEGPVDTVPTLEEHRRQHDPGDHGYDYDSEPQLVDLERVAHNDPKPDETEESDTPKLVVTPKSPALKLLPVPATTEEAKTDVPARPTPVQMITPEKPMATPAPSVSKPKPKSKLKPVTKPATATTASETPRARPVANAVKSDAPVSNRAGAGRMKNLRPIK